MLIILQPDDPRPIYQQIIDQVKEQIMNGLLPPGDELPSVRELAESLQINMHTVHRAYQELKNQGVVLIRLGQKVRVASTAKSADQRALAKQKLENEIRRLIVDAFHSGYSKKELAELFRETIQKYTPTDTKGKETES